MTKKILLALLGLLVIIQIIRPSKNIAAGKSDSDITHTYTVPVDIQQMFEAKCYDCHSNNTQYPWYFNIQPVGWWMNWHIKEGKSELNFSEFKNYDEKRANHKLEEIVEMVNDGLMPLDSYLWIHKQAKVTPQEAAAVSEWAKSLGVVIGE